MTAVSHPGYDPTDVLSDDEHWACFGLMDVEEDNTTPEEAATLREFVEAYNTASPVPAQDAARRFMSLNEDRIPCDGDFDKGWRVSWLLWDAGIAMPHHQAAILALIDAVKALPHLDATPEQEVRFANKMERWSTLDDFCWKIWQDMYDRSYRDGPYPYDKFDGESNPDLVKANAFMAHGIVAHPPDLGCSLKRTLEVHRAFSDIILTLEQDPWNHAPQELKESRDIQSKSAHEARITMLNTTVHALVPFLDIAGDILYRLTDRETLYRRFIQEPGLDATAYCGYESTWLKYPAAHLWKGDIWLSRDRWAFWKERLLWISEQDELMQRTRDEARMLVQLMGEIEGRAAQSASSSET